VFKKIRFSMRAYIAVALIAGAIEDLISAVLVGW
jgi:hypothetical protein